jgi:hypothetical protein
MLHRGWAGPSRNQGAMRLPYPRNFVRRSFVAYLSTRAWRQTPSTRQPSAGIPIISTDQLPIMPGQEDDSDLRKSCSSPRRTTMNMHEMRAANAPQRPHSPSSKQVMLPRLGQAMKEQQVETSPTDGKEPPTERPATVAYSTARTPVRATSGNEVHTVRGLKGP